MRLGGVRNYPERIQAEADLLLADARQRHGEKSPE
jgi:hypothetical protein